MRYEILYEGDGIMHQYLVPNYPQNIYLYDGDSLNVGWLCHKILWHHDTFLVIKPEPFYVLPSSLCRTMRNEILYEDDGIIPQYLMHNYPQNMCLYDGVVEMLAGSATKYYDFMTPFWS